MCQRLWDDLDLMGIKLEINSLGSPEERLRHRAELISYFEAHETALDEDARRRLHSNPLRILDTKNPAMQTLVEAAPKLSDYLGSESTDHFAAIQERLLAANIPFRINPRLVRGLDYYNLTVFEWVTDQLGAQGTVCAGGRYDGLIAQLGGKPAPAAGFAMGVERLMSLWSTVQADALIERPEAYVVHSGAGAEAAAFRLAEQLRDAGFATLMHCGGGSFKSQMKRADASGADVALILGEDEVRADEVTFKPLRGGEQVRVSRGEVAQQLAMLLLGGGDADDEEETAFTLQ
jgi:histidyl-tRNA synthetase